MSKYVLAKSCASDFKYYNEGTEVKYNAKFRTWMVDVMGSDLFLTNPTTETKESGLARLIADGWVIEEKEKVKKEGWVNIEKPRFGGKEETKRVNSLFAYDTEEEAERNSSPEYLIDTVKIEWCEYE